MEGEAKGPGVFVYVTVPSRILAFFFVIPLVHMLQCQMRRRPVLAGSPLTGIVWFFIFRGRLVPRSRGDLPHLEGLIDPVY